MNEKPVSVLEQKAIDDWLQVMPKGTVIYWVVRHTTLHRLYAVPLRLSIWMDPDGTVVAEPVSLAPQIILFRKLSTILNVTVSRVPVDKPYDGVVLHRGSEGRYEAVTRALGELVWCDPKAYTSREL